LERDHALARALSRWSTFNLVQRKASIIQRAVRRHLKKQRQTMSRTRCVQFYWRRFCRLVKYYKCVEACRLMKGRWKESVEKIER
jgi:ribosomal protein S15P/S13E